ncbi:MAG TPA: sulfatase-like hydrolase/transferase, partial [Haliangium sp.]|nr:sulfatase-like hydrolase/transferase [Haliangium sp.]
MSISTRHGIHGACCFLLGLLWIACSDKSGQSTASGALAPDSPSTNTPAGEGSGPGSAPAVNPGAAKGPTAPALDPEPRIDLVHNRFLWHLSPPEHGAGLYIPVASEGLRKYTQEYRSPWGDVVAREGQTGRALTARAATLRFPWRDDAGATRLRLRLHGMAQGQRLSVNLNGQRVVNDAVAASWQDVAFPIAAGALRQGENELQIFLGKRGPDSAYALIHSIAVEPAGEQSAEPAAVTGGDTAWPPLSPAARVAAGGRALPALTGFQRMAIYLEVPESGWLVVSTAAPQGSARFRITARAFDGTPVDLLDHQASGDAWTEHTVRVDALANRLVALDFAVTGPGAASAAWGAPRIALASTDSRPRPAPYDNAILLVIDALRSDRLTLYGETRVATPLMTAEGRSRGVVFLHNQAASPSSPPSHGSIQTGMIPRVHGVAGDAGKLEPGTPMISTQVADAGIAAGYYGNNPFGMARLEAPGRWTEFHHPGQEGKGTDCTVLMDEMLGFAEAQAKAGKRFFISSLPYEPHTPYLYHQGITDKYHPGPWGPPVGKSVDGGLLSSLSSGKVTLTDAQWSQLRGLYDGEVEHMDDCYGRLLDGLAARGLRERTLVVITADHGEGMFEHGLMGHAFGHYAELANVPLVLIGDHLVDNGLAIDTVTTHLDIAPTILDLMGVKPSERIQGQSLVPLLLRKGPWTPRVVSLEYGRSYGLRAKRWKYIVDYQQKESVFDLELDPTEQKDLMAEHPMALRYLRDLAGFFLEHRSDWRMETFGSLNNHGPGF